MILARRAEAMFWAGRYLERAQQTARLVDVTYHSVLERPAQEPSGEWSEVMRALVVEGSFASRGNGAVVEDVDAVLRFLVDDPDNPSSVRSCLTSARGNVRSVREHVSAEFWTAVNDLYLTLQARDVPAELRAEPYELLSVVRRRSQQIYGAAADTMLRDEGWAFQTLGRQLERAAAMTRLIDVRLDRFVDSDAPASFHQWATVLRSAGALEAYRWVHGHSMDPRDAVDFLLLSGEHPRSVLFCLRAAEDCLDRLGPGGRAARRVGRVRAALDYRTVGEVLDRGLHSFLGEVLEAIDETASRIAGEFFDSWTVGPVTSVAAR